MLYVGMYLQWCHGRFDQHSSAWIPPPRLCVETKQHRSRWGCTPYAHAGLWRGLHPNEHTSTHGSRQGAGRRRQGPAGDVTPGSTGCRCIMRLALERRSEYDLAMTGRDVKELPVLQKLPIMEAVWEDFRDRFDHLDVPQQQKDLLDQRRARVRGGVAQLLDWDSVKGTIGRP